MDDPALENSGLILKIVLIIPMIDVPV